MESINRPSHPKPDTRCHQRPAASPPPKTRPSPPALLLSGRQVPALRSLKTTSTLWVFPKSRCSSPAQKTGPSWLHHLQNPSVLVWLHQRCGTATPVLQNKPLTRWAVEKQYNRSPQLCSSPLSMAKVQGSKSVQDTEPPTQTNTAAAQPSSSNCTTESEHIPRKHLSVESYKPRHKDDLFGVGQYDN